MSAGVAVGAGVAIDLRQQTATEPELGLPHVEISARRRLEGHVPGPDGALARTGAGPEQGYRRSSEGILSDGCNVTRCSGGVLQHLRNLLRRPRRRRHGGTGTSGGHVAGVGGVEKPGSQAERADQKEDGKADIRPGRRTEIIFRKKSESALRSAVVMPMVVSRQFSCRPQSPTIRFGPIAYIEVHQPHRVWLRMGPRGHTLRKPILIEPLCIGHVAGLPKRDCLRRILRGPLKLH